MASASCRALGSVAFALVIWGGTLDAQSTPVKPAPNGTAAKSTAAIAREASPATVTILALGAAGDTIGQGSGFLLRSDGTILTNWHVLAGATQALVILDSGEAVDAVVYVQGDSLADLAIIRIPRSGLPTLKTRSTTPAVGERVVTIGSPLGLSRTVAEGIVSAVRTVDGRELVQISAPISPGSSGGAVLDGAGRVFAVSTSYVEGGQQLNFAVPIRYALGLSSSPGQTRPIAEVFAHLGPSAERRDAIFLQRPAPTSDIREAVGGSYFFRRSWMRFPNGAAGREAGVLLADGGVGLAVYWQVLDHDSLARRVVGLVDSLTTDELGQVALRLGGRVYNGYQTKDGFFAEALHSGASGEEPFDWALIASPDSVDLSRTTGLYRVRALTHVFSGGARMTSKPKEWTGHAAVVVEGDSIWVDLKIADTSGNISRLTAKSSVTREGWFHIQSSDGKRDLGGRVQGGVLSGEWTESRGGADRIQGTLEGARY